MGATLYCTSGKGFIKPRDPGYKRAGIIIDWVLQLPEDQITDEAYKQLMVNFLSPKFTDAQRERFISLCFDLKGTYDYIDKANLKNSFGSDVPHGEIWTANEKNLLN